MKNSVRNFARIPMKNQMLRWAIEGGGGTMG
jgi:hypothetical protein